MGELIDHDWRYDNQNELEISKTIKDQLVLNDNLEKKQGIIAKHRIEVKNENYKSKYKNDDDENEIEEVLKTPTRALLFEQTLSRRRARLSVEESNVNIDYLRKDRGKIQELRRKRRTLFLLQNTLLKRKYVNSDWAQTVGSRSKPLRKLSSFNVYTPTNKHHVFPNGSQYNGEWTSCGPNGKGEYKFFYDVLYEGMIINGEFYGLGDLTYPNGATITNIFSDGLAMNTNEYRFADGLIAQRYCEPPDRRFNIEIKDELKPAGRSYLTNNIKAREIPNGCYDSGDGFYNPKTKCVHDPNDLNIIVRIPTEEEDKWIKKNCRKAWDEVVGYRPDLFSSNWRCDSENSYFTEKTM